MVAFQYVARVALGCLGFVVSHKLREWCGLLQVAFIEVIQCDGCHGAALGPVKNQRDGGEEVT